MHLIITLLLGGFIGAISGSITHKYIPGGIIGNVIVGFVGACMERILFPSRFVRCYILCVSDFIYSFYDK